MRLGVLADIHANLPALEATLAAVGDVDGWVCAGDLVGYGPFPNECIERVASLGMTCVAGNHDLIALGRLDDARCIRVAQETLRWTTGVLGTAEREFLAALPLTAAASGVTVAHGSLDDPEEYVRTPERARDVLAAAARFAILGHTHEPWAFGADSGESLRGDVTAEVTLDGGEAWLLNPGSVGQSRSRDPRARAVVLDLGARVASFLAVEYDDERTRAALRAHGLPETACHLPPAPLARRLAGRALRAARLR